MTQETWPARLARIVAGEIRRYRTARGLTAQQLAERCSELGLPLSRNVIASLESGRRPVVGLAELIVLARTLEVPPVLLVAPVGYRETVEILPDRQATPYGAAQWFSGESELTDDGSDGRGPSLLARPLPPDASSIQLYREYVDQMSRQYRALAALRRAVAVADDDERFAARTDAPRLVEMIEQGNKYLSSLCRQIAERDLIQPPDLGAMVSDGADGPEVGAVFSDVGRPGTEPDDPPE